MPAASQSCRQLRTRRLNVTLTNRQRTRKLDSNLLRRIVKTFVAELPIRNANLAVNLVSPEVITLLNHAFLRHTGATDVISFDYSAAPVSNSHSAPDLHGEIFVCVAEAVAHASRFQTTWQSEIVRYIVHGVLHLLGYGDLTPAARRRMKRVEGQLLRRLARNFRLTKLARRPPFP